MMNAGAFALYLYRLSEFADFAELGFVDNLDSSTVDDE